MTNRVSDSAVLARDTPLFRESETGRLDKYPRATWARWGLRLLIAAGYASLAIWFHLAAAGDWSGTANEALAERIARLPETAVASDVSVIGALYPPITSILAMIVPGGALGLGVMGALFAGLMVQLIAQSMKRKGFHPAVRWVFILTLATTPVFSYIVTTNVESVLALMFFGLGMVDLVRFVTWANTQAGFRAGILFACAAFSDSTATFSALVAAFAGSVIIQSRPGARVANAVVVAFPTVALFGALALLGTAFDAGPLVMLRGGLEWNPDRAAAVLSLAASPAGLVYFAPMIVMVIASIALQYPGSGLIAILLTASTLLAYVLELTPPGNAGTTYTLMLLLAIAIVPTATTLAHRALTCTVSVVLWVIGWFTAWQVPAIGAWLDVLGGAA